jgi:hypothetical protein
MKNLKAMKVLMIVVFIIGAISCSRESHEDIQVISIDQLKGVWKWESTCGGFTGGCGYSSDAHYATIEFSSDGKFIEKRNDTIYRQVNYMVIKSNDTSGNLVLDNDEYQIPVSIVNNRLVWNQGDMETSYIKVK